MYHLPVACSELGYDEPMRNHLYFYSNLEALSFILHQDYIYPFLAVDSFGMYQYRLFYQSFIAPLRAIELPSYSELFV